MIYAIKWLFASPRRRHFMRRTLQAQVAFWDLEFQKDRLEELREDMRQQFDRVKERDTMNRSQLELERKKGKGADRKTVERLEAVIARAEPDMEAMKEQLAGLDQQISGDHPKSASSQLDALKQALDSLRWYMKHRL